MRATTAAEGSAAAKTEYNLGVRVRSLFAPVLLVIASCGGSPALGPHKNLMDQTTAGQNRCTVAKSHDRPFVIEWDATDLATFEGKAARDTVFVKYVGCEMQVLDGCVDTIPGRYGKYEDPQFTSGTVEGFDIKDEDELYAQLPLGAATLAGRVQQGDALHLRYFVSGVRTATRPAVHRGELAANPSCRDATHFVWAYNLGAFELTSTQSDVAQAKAGVGSAGAGASQDHEATALKHGGSLDSCTQQDQRGCRVPIRLALRPIDDGAAPPASAAAAADTLDASQVDPNDYRNPKWPDSPAGRAYALRGEADKKLELGDGPGCLGDLDRADALDTRFADPRRMMLRAHCLMLAGECDEGGKVWRAWQADNDKGHTETDAQLDESALAEQTQYCPASQGTPEQRVVRAHRQIREVDGSLWPDKKNAARCLELASISEGVVPSLTSDPQGKLKDLALDTMEKASECLATAGRCQDATPLFARWYRQKFAQQVKPGDMDAQIKKVQGRWLPACAPK